MKKASFLVLAVVLILLLSCPAVAEQDRGIDLLSLPEYYGWPVADIYSETYYATDGSEASCQFITRPDGTAALQFNVLDSNSRRKRIQYPMENTSVFIRDDGVAFLDFVEDHGVFFKTSGILVFGGEEYWPLWLTNKEQSERTPLGNVHGNAISAAFIDEGHYRVGNGSYAQNNGFYYIPNDGSPLLIADVEAYSGFCVNDGWFYMTGGKVDSAKNFIPYEENGAFLWKNVNFIGMNSSHLYFVDYGHFLIYETNLNGGEPRCLLDMSQDGKDFSFTTMNEDYICCVYSRELNHSEREMSFALIDLRNRNYNYITSIPCRTVGEWDTSYIYADWAHIYGDYVLFYNSFEEEIVRKMDLRTMQVSDFLPESEFSIEDNGYYTDPSAALIGDKIYYPYSFDKTMLVYTEMDGDLSSNYAGTMTDEILDVLFVDGRLILQLKQMLGSNRYIEIGY